MGAPDEGVCVASFPVFCSLTGKEGLRDFNVALSVTSLPFSDCEADIQRLQRGRPLSSAGQFKVCGPRARR